MTGCKTIEQIRTLAGAILWNGQMTEKSKQSLLPHLHLSQRASVYAEPRLSSACNLHEDIDRYSTTLHFMGTWNVKMQAKDNRPVLTGEEWKMILNSFRALWDYNGLSLLAGSYFKEVTSPSPTLAEWKFGWRNQAISLIFQLLL